MREEKKEETPPSSSKQREWVFVLQTHTRDGWWGTLVMARATSPLRQMTIHPLKAKNQRVRALVTLEPVFDCASARLLLL